MNIQQLHEKFGCDDNLFYCGFKQRGELIVCELKTHAFTASIALQGAHLLAWRPKGETDVIWLSKDAQFTQGKSIRGGIPICWPWFGAHESKPKYPAHGFARTVDWQLLDVQTTKEQTVTLHFQLDTRTLPSTIQRLWPDATVLDYYLDIGQQFKAQLITTNLSNKNIRIGQAFHTYFAVDDVHKVVVKGLNKGQYLDKVQQFLQCTQEGDVYFKGEVDRVYINTTTALNIVDKQRTLNIAKEGSHSTVVWNPGSDVAKKMGDLGAEGYLKMLCVESANAASDTVTVAAGESTELSVIYRLN